MITIRGLGTSYVPPAILLEHLFCFIVPFPHLFHLYWILTVIIDVFFQASAQVIITIEDINDNPPTLNKEVYTSHIRENSPKGTVMILVRLSDFATILNQ